MSIKVYYWGPKMMNMYGRAIGIYLTLDQAGVEYEMHPQSELAAVAPGAAFAVPCVEIDGTFMGQTPAILSVLGRKFGLLGKTPAEEMQVLHGLEDMNDIFGEHGKFVENEERKDKWFSYFDKKLAERKWVGGTEDPTVADFHGVFTFEWVNKKKIDFSKYENVVRWLADLKEYPVVKKMYASCVDGRSMIP